MGFSRPVPKVVPKPYNTQQQQQPQRVVPLRSYISQQPIYTNVTLDQQQQDEEEEEQQLQEEEYYNPPPPTRRLQEQGSGRAVSRAALSRTMNFQQPIRASPPPSRNWNAEPQHNYYEEEQSSQNYVNTTPKRQNFSKTLTMNAPLRYSPSNDAQDNLIQNRPASKTISSSNSMNLNDPEVARILGISTRPNSKTITANPQMYSNDSDESNFSGNAGIPQRKPPPNKPLQSAPPRQVGVGRMNDSGPPPQTILVNGGRATLSLRPLRSAQQQQQNFYSQPQNFIETDYSEPSSSYDSSPSQSFEEKSQNSAKPGLILTRASLDKRDASVKNFFELALRKTLVLCLYMENISPSPTDSCNFKPSGEFEVTCEVEKRSVSLACIDSDGYYEIRKLFGVNFEVLMNSLRNGKLSGGISPGRSGSYFYLTHDKRFILKSLAASEVRLLKEEFFKKYFCYVRENKDTLLPRFYGCYRLTAPDQEPITFIMMSNVFADVSKLDVIYDLKGSVANRTAKDDEKRPGRTPIFKDNDLKEHGRKISLDNRTRATFATQLEKDASFLKESGIMDYSFLLGIRNISKDELEALKMGKQNVFNEGMPTSHSVGVYQSFFQQDEGGYRSRNSQGQPLMEMYYFGVIDILQKYDIYKASEGFIKGLRKERNQLSAVDQETYYKRYVDYLLSEVVVDLTYAYGANDEYEEETPQVQTFQKITRPPPSVRGKSIRTNRSPPPIRRMGNPPPPTNTRFQPPSNFRETYYDSYSQSQNNDQEEYDQEEQEEEVDQYAPPQPLRQIRRVPAPPPSRSSRQPPPSRRAQF
jgi:hypothetical protein